MASIEEVQVVIAAGAEELRQAHIDQVAIKLGQLELRRTVLAAAEEVQIALIEADRDMVATVGYANQIHRKVQSGTTALMTALVGAARPEAGGAIESAQYVSKYTEDALQGVDEMQRRCVSMLGHVAALLEELAGYEVARSQALHNVQRARGAREDAISHSEAYSQGLNR